MPSLKEMITSQRIDFLLKEMITCQWTDFLSEETMSSQDWFPAKGINFLPKEIISYLQYLKPSLHDYYNITTA